MQIHLGMHATISRNFFPKWKSSLKINQMYLYVFLLSNYLDSFSRKGCLAMITIAIHKRFHTEIFARIVNKQPRSETGQHRKCYYMLFAVHRFFNSVKKTRNLLSLDKYFVKYVGMQYNLVLIPLTSRNF